MTETGRIHGLPGQLDVCRPKRCCSKNCTSIRWRIDTYYLDDDSPLTEEQVREAFELALAARLAQQAQWTAEQTTTNLDRAFEELEEAGVVARQDFACCMNCGSSEIFDERDDSRLARLRLLPPAGHGSFDRGGQLYLAYGRFSSQIDLHELVDKQILPVLTSHGLSPEWDGDLDTRILLSNAQWYCPIKPEV